jgi:hypothetical protein
VRAGVDGYAVRDREIFLDDERVGCDQLLTWNDYEEGSELKTGIDDCVTIFAALSGNLLSWTATGSLTAIDHFTVFISSDGQNLMSLGDFPVTTNSFDLTSANMAPANYKLYVKAVGKPSLANQTTPAVAYSIADLPPNAQLSVAPESGMAPLVVNASTTASLDPDGTIASSSINFGDGTMLPGPSTMTVSMLSSSAPYPPVP